MDIGRETPLHLQLQEEEVDIGRGTPLHLQLQEEELSYVMVVSKRDITGETVRQIDLVLGEVGLNDRMRCYRTNTNIGTTRMSI